MQATLNESVRRRDAGEDFDVADAEEVSTVQAPPPNHKISHNRASTPEATAPLGLALTSIATSAAPMTKTQCADLSSIAEKEDFRRSYAMKVRQRSQQMEISNTPSPRNRTVKDNAEEL